MSLKHLTHQDPGDCAADDALADFEGALQTAINRALQTCGVRRYLQPLVDCERNEDGSVRAVVSLHTILELDSRDVANVTGAIDDVAGELAAVLRAVK